MFIGGSIGAMLIAMLVVIFAASPAGRPALNWVLDKLWAVIVLLVKWGKR